jgi:pimeloyl-[acyl-carrier protein] methyl ester esterase
MSARVWRYQAEAFARSFRVVTVDLRGHGESSSAGAGFAFDDFAADIAELFTRLDLRNASVIGWSMGVQVALRAFSRLRERIASLVLVGGTPKFTASEDYPFGLPRSETRSMAIRLKKNYVKTMGDFFNGMFAEGELSRESYQRIVRDFVMGGKTPGPETALKTLETLVSSDVRPLLPETDAPVLLIHGGEDVISLPDASRFMARQLPHATLKMFEGAGHAPFISRPDGFNALLSSFLEDIYGRD